MSIHYPSDTTNQKPLEEGEDFYFNDQGLMVFTEKYHLKRGHCCTSGCTHCPYGYGESIDHSTPVELQMNQESSLPSADDLLEQYSDFLKED